jgi:hypothetical protein
MQFGGKVCVKARPPHLPKMKRNPETRTIVLEKGSHLVDLAGHSAFRFVRLILFITSAEFFPVVSKARFEMQVRRKAQSSYAVPYALAFPSPAASKFNEADDRF